MILYTYVMTNDSGFAPCVRSGILTLACCKGGKNGGMRMAIYKDSVNRPNEDIWVLGVCGKKLAAGNGSMEYKPVYFAKVTDIIEMIQYFSNPKYKDRADYRAYEVINGKLVSTDDNPHSTPDLQLKDECGKYVVYSDRFIYWGDACGDKDGKEVADAFRDIFSDSAARKGIKKHCRGYMVDREYADDIEVTLKEKVADFRKSPGSVIKSQKHISGEYIPDHHDNGKEIQMKFCCGKGSCGKRK